jgi:adenylosuccinate lyase
LAADAEVAGRVPAAALDAAMDPARHLRHVDTVFARVFGDV